MPPMPGFALQKSKQKALLQAMSNTGMKVLRTFVSFEAAGQKNNDSLETNDLEQNGVGTRDDTILNRIDQLMVNAHAVGIKLLIALYDVNWLNSGSVSAYANSYGVEGFYTNPDTINNFYQRITYITNIHKNALLGNQPWSELGGYIFGYEPMNEPSSSHVDWVCGAAQQIRNNVGDRNQLILSGGFSCGSGECAPPSEYFSTSCAVDVIAIHDYNDDWDGFLGTVVANAQSAGKKIIIEEWGSEFSSNDGSRVANMQNNVQKINEHDVSWLYWELITNIDPHQGQDFEIDALNGQDWSTLESLSRSTIATNSAFDFSASLAT
ncbi:glycoside hydrolase [Punctularia strigosozonata HHB-11173 SS5]|uniref:glycoside hydrolase n=1 Tax=Punctularia strigosozonata (strain HHB-11173) TaxID=741275 RepID=UPI0004417263|nr:glycoside hydrolase [Punctularia strigosozonata HHB-11173 SS5]EIN10943.1 glycoside hydrolase [Punctularia strigosozonata HHB-11173 SS5]